MSEKTFRAQGNLIITNDGERVAVENITLYRPIGENVQVFTKECDEGEYWDFKGSIEDFDAAYAEAYRYSKCGEFLEKMQDLICKAKADEKSTRVVFVPEKVNVKE